MLLGKYLRILNGFEIFFAECLELWKKLIDLNDLVNFGICLGKF